MQLHGADEQNVSRSQLIAVAFDIILDIPREKEIDLIEIVVVQGDLLEIGVLVAENLIGIPPHMLAAVEALYLGGHDGFPPLPGQSGGLAGCAFFTAYSNFCKVSSNIYNAVCKKV